MHQSISVIYKLISETTQKFNSSMVLGTGLGIGGAMFTLAQWAKLDMPRTLALSITGTLVLLGLGYTWFDYFISNKRRKLRYTAAYLALCAAEEPLGVVRQFSRRPPSWSAVSEAIERETWDVVVRDGEFSGTEVTLGLNLTESYAVLLQRELDRLYAAATRPVIVAPSPNGGKTSLRAGSTRERIALYNGR